MVRANTQLYNISFFILSVLSTSFNSAGFLNTEKNGWEVIMRDYQAKAENKISK